MKESETNIDKCKATRVMMSPSGALVMALPIFIKLVEGWEQHGYIVYHPAYGEMVRT